MQDWQHRSVLGSCRKRLVNSVMLRQRIAGSELSDGSLQDYQHVHVCLRNRECTEGMCWGQVLHVLHDQAAMHLHAELAACA
jgi:hypothetical protein